MVHPRHVDLLRPVLPLDPELEFPGPVAAVRPHLEGDDHRHLDRDGVRPQPGGAEQERGNQEPKGARHRVGQLSAGGGGTEPGDLPVPVELYLGVSSWVAWSIRVQALFRASDTTLI